MLKLKFILWITFQVVWWCAFALGGFVLAVCGHLEWGMLSSLLSGFMVLVPDRPPRTTESVMRELVEGLEDGIIVVDREEDVT